MTGFSDPVAGGGGALVRPSIHSPGYTPGSSGWSINKDGSVEFNNGVFRGTVSGGSFVGTDYIQNSAGSFFYSGTPANGNLICSISAADGIDGFGNHYVAGVGVYNYGAPQLFAAMQSGQMLIGNIIGGVPDTVEAGVWAPTINGIPNTMAFESPTNGAMIQPVFVELASGNGTATTGQPGAPYLRVSDPTSNQIADMHVSGTLIKTDISANLATWQAAAMQSGYTANLCQYRLDAQDNVVWDLNLTQTTGVAGSGGAVVIGAVPAQYRPKAARMVPCAWESSGSVSKGAATLVFNATGTVSLLWPSTTASGDKFAANVSIPLGNIS